MLVGNEKLNVDLVKYELKPVFEKYGVRRATLFGSVAKGNNSIDSDVDILKHDEIIKGSRVDNEIKNTGLLIYD